MNKKIFLACSKGLFDKVKAYQTELEIQGNDVYNPLTDTNQGANEKTILQQNLEGVTWADEVHVLWDGTSNGTIFDLGTAYALGRPIKVVYVPNHHWLLYLNKNRGEYLE